ncbi:CBS domain-containing protein [Thiolapillus sp.]
MSIEDIMTKVVVSVRMDDSIKVIKNIFENTSFHHLLVVSSGKLVGVISDRDLLRVLNPNIGTVAETHRDTAPLNKKAHQIMTRELVTLPADAEISDAIAVFNTQTISCIPIVDDKLKPVGIVSWRDILRQL